ncbi:MAG: hypothetical protein AB1665_06170 [Candidatus Thermoplasmatota archaeon]
MGIKQLELVSIDARRFTKMGEHIRNVRIDHNSTVTMITELNEREAGIDFRFTANYQAMGIIKIEGRLIYEGDAAALARQWSAENRMPDEVASNIHSAVMSSCIPEAVLIARDLRLPPPIPMPNVQIGKGKQVKPSSGIEVA